jgi:hypothetical protein
LTGLSLILFKLEDPLKRAFYDSECIKGIWEVEGCQLDYVVFHGVFDKYRGINVFSVTGRVKRLELLV